MTPERTKEEILKSNKRRDEIIRILEDCPDMSAVYPLLHTFESWLRESQPVESKWVSVKERTPEFDGQYLCFIEAPQECGNIWRFQEVVSLHFNEWITSEDQYVTHWKPLDPNP